jgi:hypothetical protein
MATAENKRAAVGDACLALFPAGWPSGGVWDLGPGHRCRSRRVDGREGTA